MQYAVASSGAYVVANKNGYSAFYAVAHLVAYMVAYKVDWTVILYHDLSLFEEITENTKYHQHN